MNNQFDPRMQPGFNMSPAAQSFQTMPPDGRTNPSSYIQNWQNNMNNMNVGNGYSNNTMQTPPQGMQPQNSQPTGFVGRYVSSPNEIMASEVPMDGRVSIFPTSDLQEVYLKGWNSNGVMITVKYIVDPTWQAPTPETPDVIRRLENLEKTVAANNKKTPAKNSQKEGNE